MPFPGFGPQMRAMRGNQDKSWFRIENAHVDTEGSDDETTHVYIYDVIGDSWWGDATPASEFVKQMSKITTPNIALHLNSPGGDIFDGTAIFNALKYHDAKVTVYIDGLAASAASFIAQAGDEVIMREGSMMMIHDGSAGAWGYASDLRKTADILDKLSDNISNIYANRAGNTARFWRDLMIEETWYNANEAVDAGLADKAEGKIEEETKAAANKWVAFLNLNGHGPAQDPLVARQRIANRLKENTVAGPQNTEGTQPDESDKNPASPQVNPDADTTEGDTGDVAEEREEQTNPGGTEVDQPTTENSITINGASITSGSIISLKVVNVDGREYTVPAAVATHIETLEGFRNETMTQARKDFVTGLVAGNKILAPQAKDMEEYALGLTNEGYVAWTKLYENSPALPMLAGSHAEGTSNHSGSQTQAQEDTADRIAVLKGIIAQHKMGGMNNEKIMEKPSYKELVQLDPNFKL